MWYGYDSNYSWIGNEAYGRFYNWDFGDNNLSTTSIASSRVWGYNTGYAEYRTSFQWDSWGEYWYLLWFDRYYWYG